MDTFCHRKHRHHAKNLLSHQDGRFRWILRRRLSHFLWLGESTIVTIELVTAVLTASGLLYRNDSSSTHRWWHRRHFPSHHGTAPVIHSGAISHAPDREQVVHGWVVYLHWPHLDTQIQFLVSLSTNRECRMGRKIHHADDGVCGYNGYGDLDTFCGSMSPIQ